MWQEDVFGPWPIEACKRFQELGETYVCCVLRGGKSLAGAGADERRGGLFSTCWVLRTHFGWESSRLWTLVFSVEVELSPSMWQKDSDQHRGLWSGPGPAPSPSCRAGRSPGALVPVSTTWRPVVYTAGTSCAHRGLRCSSHLLLGETNSPAGAP